MRGLKLRASLVCVCVCARAHACVCVCGNPVAKDFEFDNKSNFSILAESKSRKQSRKQGAGSLFRDTSQRS